jgi:hypothetical protein
MKTLSIKKAKYAGDLSVELFFNDGVVRTVDVGYFLKRRPHPQHNKYIKYDNFKKFHIQNGNIVWGKNEDLSFPIYQLYRGKISL